MMRTRSWLPLLAIFWCSSARAIPAPIPEKQLAAAAHAIVVGLVIEAKLVKLTNDGRYATSHYRGVLEVKRALKGDLQPGAKIPLHWASERWVGQGRRPVGRGLKPFFFACELVRVYLWKHKGRYNLSGRRSVKRPPTYLSPSAKRRTIRCVKGRPR